MMKRKITCVLLLAFAMLSLQTTHAQTKGVTVTGNCYLEGQTNHSGIKVLFTAVSPSAVTTEVFTTSTGAFIAGLAEGIYTVEYSKTGYVTQTLPGTFSFFASTTLADMTLIPGFSATMEVSGPQSGIWESGYIVKAIDNITINAGDTLIIQHGVTVLFMGYYRFSIVGVLLAIGIENDSIVFTSGQPESSPNDWRDIYFSGGSGSIVSYSKIQYAQNGFNCGYLASPSILNNKITNNYSGIESANYSNPTIINNLIENNINYGILISNGGNGFIKDNMISNNRCGIGFFTQSNVNNATILNNIITSNQTGIDCYKVAAIIRYNKIINNIDGISCDNSSPTIQNNTINNNNQGISCSDASSPTIKNNVICQNSDAGIYTESSSAPAIYNNIMVGNQRGVWLTNAPETLSYNLFWQNVTLYEGSGVPATFSQIVIQNANGDPCDTYLNLFTDPEFAFTGEYTFEACTNLVGDENTDNDCKAKIVSNGGVDFTNPFSNQIVSSTQNINSSFNGICPMDKAPGTFTGPIQYSDVDYYLQFEYPIDEVAYPGQAGIETDGSYIYTTDWQAADAGKFYAYSLTGTFLGQITVAGLTSIGGGIRDMAFDGTYFYGSPANTTTYQFTLNGATLAGTLIGSWVAPTAARAIAYNATADGFYANNWSTTIYLYSRSGATISTMPTIGDESYYGFAWDPQGPYLWGYSQKVGTSQNMLYKMSLPGGSINDQFDMLTVLNLPTYGLDIAGGLFFHPDLIEGYNTLGGLVQNKCIWGLEIENAGPPSTNDVGVAFILTPISGGSLGNETVTIRLKNYGTISQNNIPYSVIWSGGLQNGSYSGIHEETINPRDYVDITLPVTVDFTIPNDYHLMPTSPCIDAGNPDTAYYDPDGTIADIGAFYYDQGSVAPVINDFTATPVTGRMPLVVQFSQDISGPATEYQWVFGDGSTSTLPNPVHVYNAMGYYTVSLMVTGPGGSDILVKTEYIQVLAPVPPLNAAFTGTPLLGYAPLEVQFTNQSTGPWQSLLWDFGDGNISTELNPLHVYQQPGDYSVSLTLFVTTTEKTELKENYIHAIAPQEVVAMFGVSGNNGAAPYTVAFFDESFGSVDSLSWDFGDGATSTLANPTHVYLLPGEYTATLTAYGPLNTGTASETILVESVAPVILAITDRPNDQGGYVYVQFKKSFYDNVIPGKSTESYTIQRQDNGHWVSLNTTLAYGEAVYMVEAATLNDSTALSPGITAFRVIAGMDEGTWISQPGEGYSVDNLSPSTPDGMEWLITGSQLDFSWNPCPEEDFRYFAVYRSDENGLFPEIPVATLTGTSFSVAVAPDEVFIYAVTAFDFAGNESLFSEEISNLDRQEILIPQGWSGISGYLEPYNSQIENMFSPVADNLTILMNETGVYWPGQNVNTLGTWQISQGYQIKMTQQTGYFLRGFKLSDHSLGLASGWSLIPVLSENNADVAALFASTGLELVKEVAGFRLYWPAYGINTLGYLEPGRAYQVLMNTPGTIVFPAEPMKNSAANQPPFVNITPWNEITATPFTHVIAFGKEACRVFKTGDIIAAFTSDGLCAGMQPYNSGTLGLVAFGDDGITADRDGFLQGEALDFRMFRPITGEQFNLEVFFDNLMNTGDFAENGVSVVTLVKMSPFIPGTILPDEISIFPNPSHGLFSITGIETQADIAIFNAFGLEVTNFRVNLPGEIDLSGQPKGVYFLHIKTGEEVFIKKLVLN